MVDKSCDFRTWAVAKLRWLLRLQIIYLGVTDFLQKRETEKLQKEEESKKKKRVKKRRVRARSGPRGFGQKINEDDEFDD